MNLYFGKRIGSLQKTEFWKTIGINKWITEAIRRKVLRSASEVKVYTMDVCNQTSSQFTKTNYHLFHYYSNPVAALRLLNNYQKRLEAGASEYQLQDLENAREQLEEYNKLFTLMEYAGTLGEHITLLMGREDTNNLMQIQNIWRSAKMNLIENMYPEIEVIVSAYYDLLKQLEDYPEWQDKIQSELGEQVAYLYSSLSDNSRDYIAQKSELFAKFNDDKQKFFQ